MIRSEPVPTELSLADYPIDYIDAQLKISLKSLYEDDETEAFVDQDSSSEDEKEDDKKHIDEEMKALLMSLESFDIDF